jgi:hypothetical protein
MTNEIALTPRAHAEDVVVLARSPEEMAVAQQGLVAWAEQRIARLEAALAECRTNLEIAVKRKWKQTGWIRQVKHAEARVTFYKKVKEALEAGYCIMPDLPVQILAVRTDRKAPSEKYVKSRWSHPENDLPNAEAKALPSGEGRYVDQRPFFMRWYEENPDKYGRVQRTNFARATSYDEVFDFPMKLVKPQILDDTGRALALKLFDEIGILPTAGRRGASAMATSDPVVVGRIVREENKRRHVLTFLISWWIDTSQI